MHRLEKVLKSPKNMYGYYIISRIKPICEKFKYNLKQSSMFWFEIINDDNPIVIIKVNPLDFNMLVFFEEEVFDFQNIDELADFIGVLLTKN